MRVMSPGQGCQSDGSPPLYIVGDTKKQPLEPHGGNWPEGGSGGVRSIWNIVQDWQSSRGGLLARLINPRSAIKTKYCEADTCRQLHEGAGNFDYKFDLAGSSAVLSWCLGQGTGGNLRAEESKVSLPWAGS